MGCSWNAVMFAADTADTATPNQQLLDELHKPIRKYQKQHIFIFLWITVGLLILLICNEEAHISRYILSCVINIFSKYAWVFGLFF